MQKEVKYIIGIDDVGKTIRKKVINQIRLPGYANKNIIQLIPQNELLESIVIQPASYIPNAADKKIAENIESMYLYVYKPYIESKELAYLETDCSIVVNTIYQNKNKYRLT